MDNRCIRNVRNVRNTKQIIVLNTKNTLGEIIFQFPNNIKIIIREL